MHKMFLHLSGAPQNIARFARIFAPKKIRGLPWDPFGEKFRTAIMLLDLKSNATSQKEACWISKGLLVQQPAIVQHPSGNKAFVRCAV